MIMVASHIANPQNLVKVLDIEDVRERDLQFLHFKIVRAGIALAGSQFHKMLGLWSVTPMQLAERSE
jgi:hypothetical protein